jgi:hypothetical protein
MSLLENGLVSCQRGLTRASLLLAVTLAVCIVGSLAVSAVEPPTGAIDPPLFVVDTPTATGTSNLYVVDSQYRAMTLRATLH